ncbi:LOW QUALITY PROTEIN: hypothetical protein CFOL_v3_27320, partial [Cephalotus follicularis]
MRVSGISLGISCREYSVDKNKGANNLSTKTSTLGVSRGHNIGSTTQNLILAALESLDYTCTTDGTKALHNDVEDCPCKGQLPCQQTKGHCWVDVSTCWQKTHFTGHKSSAVNKGKDHATKGPSNALDTNSATLGLRLEYTHDSQNGDVQEQKGGHELCNASSVERPLELTRLKQWCWWWLLVVLVCL